MNGNAMSVRVITLDERGDALAAKLAEGLPRYLARPCTVSRARSGQDGELSALYAGAFASCDGIVCVMAAGIAVRMLAPLARSKYEDPAVVVLDDRARWAISLLSGHEGGANELAYAVAASTGAEPVITTGSETRRTYVLGIGCRRGIGRGSVAAALAALHAETGLGPADFRCAATIRLKERETGLIDELAAQGIALRFIEERRVNEYDGPYARGGAAEQQLGVRAVAEPCALLAGRNATLHTPKRVFDGVTLAIAREDA